VGNAVKFTDHGVIDVHVLWEKQAGSSHITLVLEVQDTGLGIPQDKLDAIFKPFVQAGAHREKEKQGTGLGLSIVKRLTEIMGGTVNHQPVPRELLAQLQQLLVSPWPTLRDSAAVNESKMFAQGLEGQGQSWQCAPLTAYARKLLADTENYAVMDLEKHLGEFSELVGELGKNIRE
jgi:signal transduction histidine kinase